MLAGYKTYITGVLAILAAVGAHLSGEMDLMAAIGAVIAAVQTMNLRDAISKARKASVVE